MASVPRHKYFKIPILLLVQLLCLDEEGAKRGGNGVINVRYERGVSMTSWKALTAYGEAVIFESDEKVCPSCAETIKAAATKCRYCQTELK